MEFAGEYLLTKILTLSESIARRAFQKVGEQADSKYGSQQGSRTIQDVMMAIEKETAQILDCLSSQQQSKIDSAYQYIKFAMSDLQAWNEESKPQQNLGNYSDQLRYNSPLSVSPNFTIQAPTNSKYFRDAIWQLRQADEWATEAFNDKRNSKALVRVEALHIRLFCRALLDWDNKRLWFAKWRQVLEPFFSDRQFVRYAMGEQSFTSKLFTDERAKPVFERLVQLSRCLEKLIWGMLLKDASLAPYAREFAVYFDKNTTLAPDVKLSTDWPGFRTFHLSYYELNEDIELKLCSDRLMIRLYEFKSITRSIDTQIWAIEHAGRLVSFDANEPDCQSLVINDGKMWLSVGYGLRNSKIYATSESDTFISVFDPITGQLMDEKIHLPNGHLQSYAYKMTVTRDCAIFLHEKGSGKGFVRFPNDDSQWLPLKTGDYCAILQGSNDQEIIGLKFKGYYLNADIIRKIRKNDSELEAFVSQQISERIFLPHEPQRSLLAVDYSSDSSVITIACETEKLNYMISMGVKTGDQDEIIGFPVKDVSSFDPKYTDWKMSREMIEADGKLFLLFV